MKVVLDPGHGVEEPGKRSPDGSFLEHEGNLDMAFRIKKHLERHNVTVVMTRTDEHDVELEHRVKISNDAHPDLFVSVHSNAAGNGEDWYNARGFGIYTSMAGADAGRNRAARMVINRAVEEGIHLWGGGLHHEAFYVVRNTVASAILIEQLFHDNKEDVALLKDEEYRQKIARAISKGVLDFLGLAWMDETTEDDSFVCPHCGQKIAVVKG